MNYQLLNLMATRSGGLQAVVDAIEDYLKAARVRYNSEMGPRALGRLETELLPDARRQLSSYRARFGALIEFLLGMIIDTMLKDDYQERLRLSFVVTHQYPDFYLRDVEGKVQLRIECKTLHVKSEEYSARFRTPISDISADDILMYVSWDWRPTKIGGRSLLFPEVLQVLCIPAMEVAQERDLHLEQRGGRIGEDGKPYVPKRSPATGWSVDSNFGKINRIVHRSRRVDELTPNLQRFVGFARRYSAARTTDVDASGADLAAE